MNKIDTSPKMLRYVASRIGPENDDFCIFVIQLLLAVADEKCTQISEISDITRQRDDYRARLDELTLLYAERRERVDAQIKMLKAENERLKVELKESGDAFTAETTACLDAANAVLDQNERLKVDSATMQGIEAAAKEGIFSIQPRAKCEYGADTEPYECCRWVEYRYMSFCGATPRAAIDAAMRRDR